MADRTVRVNLIAQATGYVQGMEQASRKTRETASEAEKLAQKGRALQTVGVAALGIGVAAATGLTLAVAKFAEFDQAMSNVKAVTQESASNMGLLRDAALEFGASSVFTATEAANAIEELGKAGISTADILGGALEGSLNLASAGELGIARAAEIASTTLAQFGLAGEDASRVADTLAAGAGKALGSVDDLANGLKFVGPIAASMGVSLEETTGVLSAFAMQGILGEQAGTSLRGMLSSLTSPSKMARTEIERLGIQLYDGQGKFLGLENAAGELQKAYGGMTDAQRDASLGMVFGNAQVTAARILYQEGASGVSEWTDAVSESGYAAQIANDRLDNLNGDIEALGGAFDTYLIKSGSAANDTLRTLVQSLTFLVEGVGELPQPMLNAGMAVGAVTAAVGLAGGAALIAVPKIVEFRAAMSTLGLTAGGVARSVLLTGGAIAGATALVGFFVTRAASAAATTQELAGSLDAATGATTKYTREIVARKLAETGAYEAAKEAGITQRDLTDAVLEGGDALDEVKQKLAGNNNIGTFFTGVGIRAGNAKMEITDLANSVEDSGEQFEHQKKALAGAADANDDAADAAATHEAALNALQGKSEDTTESIEELADIIRGFGSATLDVREANRNLEQAYDDLTQSIIDNGTSLDITTEKGRANQSAIDDIVKATLEAAGATAEHTGSQADAIPVIEAGRAKLLEMLAAFGITGQAAEDYVDELGLIPGNVTTAVSLHTETAITKLEGFIRDYSGRTIPLYVDAKGRPINAGQYADGGAIGYAGGGAIRGFGGPRQDNIPILASVGEHVLDAEDVKRLGGQSGVYRMRESLYSGDYAGAARMFPAPVQYAFTPTQSAPAAGAQISMPIYAQPGMSAETVGRIAADQLNFALRGA